jgi:hypothetical protein
VFCVTSQIGSTWPTPPDTDCCTAFQAHTDLSRWTYGAGEHQVEVFAGQYIRLLLLNPLRGLLTLTTGAGIAATHPPHAKHSWHTSPIGH